jgi:Second Messenger Oligonucleotide or Dinucleotide Synthetase domain
MSTMSISNLETNSKEVNMATTVKQAFQQFSTNLEITDRQTTLVASRRQNVVSFLKKGLTLHKTESKLIGSWDRRTLTRYLSEADVDVMVILNYSAHKDWDNAAGTIKALDRFRAILDEAYPNTSKRRDRNCITMQFSEFRLDVVPAFEYTDGSYSIPDSVRQLWVPTDPFTFAERITAVNTNMDGIFVPLIKMVKAWNRNVGWPIRSFHLECLLYNHYSNYTQSYTYPSTLAIFFGALSGYLSSACFEPVEGDRVDTYLDNGAARSKRQIAIDKARAAAALAKEAHEDEEKYSASVAIGEWKSLFGEEFFPTYG